MINLKGFCLGGVNSDDAIPHHPLLHLKLGYSVVQNLDIGKQKFDITTSSSTVGISGTSRDTTAIAIEINIS